MVIHIKEKWQGCIHILEEHPVQVIQVMLIWVAYLPTNSDTHPLIRDSRPPIKDTLTHNKINPLLLKDKFPLIPRTHLPTRDVLVPVILLDTVARHGETRSALWLLPRGAPPRPNLNTDTKNQWQPCQTPGLKLPLQLSILERR